AGAGDGNSGMLGTLSGLRFENCHGPLPCRPGFSPFALQRGRGDQRLNYTLAISKLLTGGIAGGPTAAKPAPSCPFTGAAKCLALRRRGRNQPTRPDAPGQTALPHQQAAAPPPYR